MASDSEGLRLGTPTILILEGEMLKMASDSEGLRQVAKAPTTISLG